MAIGGLATAVLRTLPELFWRFGHWDEGSKRQKRAGWVCSSLPFASFRVPLGAPGLELGCRGDPPGHRGDIGGAVLAGAETLMLNLPKTQAQSHRFFGPVEPEAEVPLAVLCQDHSRGDVCREGRGGAATPPGMDIFGLQILVISSCSEFSPGVETGSSQLVLKGLCWAILGCSGLQKQHHSLKPCQGSKVLIKAR